MVILDPVILVQLVGFSAFLWLALYLLVRVQYRTPLILVGVGALLGQAVFLAPV